MVLLNIDKLQELREKNKDKIIVFCSGSFDLLHAGHILFFEDCKKHGDLLLVAVGNDSVIRGLKGDNRPILNEKVRIKIVDSLKMVDYTVLDTRPYLEAGDEKFIYDDKPIIEKLKPDRWIINDDALGIQIRKDFADKLGVELIILKRYCPEEFDNISTTKIIEKIKAQVKNYSAK